MLPDIQPGNTKILYFFNCLLDGMHTKIKHICDFSRCRLNARFKCSHPTFAPRSQICFIYFPAGCALAGEHLSATKLQFYVILKVKRVILDKRWKLYRRLYK